MDDKTLLQVHQLRLAGFVDKNEASVEVLVEAIQRVAKGKVYFSPSMLQAVRKLRNSPLAFQKILTPREQEVLTLIGAGMTDEEIGEKLGLTIHSAHSHRQNLLDKLDFHSTPELMRFASETGFWKPQFRKMELMDRYHVPE